MKKKLYIMFVLAAFAVVPSVAQQQLQGTVVDKKGNPIPGAKVESVKGGVSTVTDMNGAFVLESQLSKDRLEVSLPGRYSKKVNAQTGEDMTIQAGGKTGGIERAQFFIAPQALFLSSDSPFDINHMSFGLMLGCVRKFGGYLKGDYNKFSEDNGIIQFMDESNSYKIRHMSVSGGAVWRVCKPLMLYLGAGFCEQEMSSLSESGQYLKTASASLPVVDAGIILCTNHLMVNVGIQPFIGTPDFTPSEYFPRYANYSYNAGIGALNVGIGFLF